MKYKFNFKNTAITLIAVFTLFFLAEYLFNREYKILFFAVCFFSVTVLICLFIYLLLLFDNRYRLTYADADELSDETKAKIIKEKHGIDFLGKVAKLHFKNYSVVAGNTNGEADL